MIHVKRICWIAAWSVWLWLGFGLYRELPRDLGRVVCQLPWAEVKDFNGFLGDEPLFIISEFKEEKRCWELQLWDAVRGTLARTSSFPKGGDGGIEKYSPTREFVVTERTTSRKDAERIVQMTSLDLRTGKWIDLPSGDRNELIYHVEKPWVVFWDFGRQGEVFVVELRTGKKIWRWKRQLPGKPTRELFKEPFFIGDKLAVPTYQRQPDEEEFDPKKVSLEVWSIPDGKEPDRLVERFLVGDGASASPNGRIAWHTYTDDPTSTDVFDLHNGKFVFSDPPRDLRKEIISASGGWSGPRISPDGRLLCGTMCNKLWEVDTGRVLWSEREDLTWNGWDEQGRVEIKEEWTIPYQKDVLTTTYALRDALSGRLLHRSWDPTLSGRSRDETMVYDQASHSIRGLPLRVNWMLLAICQIILASPMAIVWVVLRWRRKRSVPT